MSFFIEQIVNRLHNIDRYPFPSDEDGMMAKIFISYSRVDREFVETLAKYLRRLYGDDNVWFDKKLTGGDKWWDTILDFVAGSDVFVYLLSNESVTSPYCRAEFQEAQRLRKPVITVQIRDRTNISGELADIHWVDMTRGFTEIDGYNELIFSINKQKGYPFSG